MKKSALIRSALLSIAAFADCAVADALKHVASELECAATADGETIALHNILIYATEKNGYWACEALRARVTEPGACDHYEGMADGYALALAILRA